MELIILVLVGLFVVALVMALGSNSDQPAPSPYVVVIPADNNAYNAGSTGCVWLLIGLILGAALILLVLAQGA